jgi:FO synthase
MSGGEAIERLLADARTGRRLGDADALTVLLDSPGEALLATAEEMTLEGFGRDVGYSRKVFIPLTRLCRDVCRYCTFAEVPRNVTKVYLDMDDVLGIARAGAAAGCKEGLFTLGDKPELRYAAARRTLAALGHTRTIEYLERAARAVLDETGLLPHLNPGVMDESDIRRLRPVSASMGLMLESASDRLCERGGPHWGSPDKQPVVRLATIRAAGEARVPFTTGLLVGIGETRREIIESLLVLRELHERYGHIQELIIQNFRAKPDTPMAGAPDASLAVQQWTIAAARLLFGPSMSIQAPPNLRSGELRQLIVAGINDWGGISPVTPDHVNPEAAWPELTELARQTEAADRELVERLAIVPSFAMSASRWADAALRPRIERLRDAQGYARADGWHAGALTPPPAVPTAWVRASRRVSPAITRVLAAARNGERLDEAAIVTLFRARGVDRAAVLEAADALRRETVGDGVSYVVNRNINYTNICTYHCGFCAFSKGRSARSLRGPGYLLDLEEVAARSREAWERGATEVCLQGGIHPSFTGETYLDIVAAVKNAVPAIHVHAFSPLEVTHGARTLGLPLRAFLERLKTQGLSTLPGTAAEILDDEVRAVLCPDKLSTDEWLEVMETAHGVGLRSTATIMFGHVDRLEHWARHLLRVRDQQERSGGFTEFVPLPFVHMEAPLWRKGLARSGPVFNEALAMHAIARLALFPCITHVQTSWVKMGAAGAALALAAGADDLGGTLMNESITRAAGGAHGQEMDAARMHELALRIGRRPWQRTTLYGVARQPVPPPGEALHRLEPGGPRSVLAGGVP